MPLPAWMDLAWAEIGQQERAGNADNPRILDYYRDAGHAEAKRDEIAWCAAFVGAVLKRAGLSGSGSLMARSYLGWGEPLTAGRLGAIAVFTRGSDTAAGHVAFYLDADADRVYVLGGNQGDAVTVTAIVRDRLIGLRWPSGTVAAATKEDASVAATPTSQFASALAHVLELEGGWTEDPYDPGGPTNLGITLATLAAHRGVTLDAASFASLRQQLRGIAMSEVETIYRHRYWLPCRADELPAAIALMHFDAAVNHGVGTAARMLQAAARVTVDGDIGSETLAACTDAAAAGILERYADARRVRYRSLSHFWRFGRGWLARVDATLKRATTISKAKTEGDPAMPDITTSTTPPATPPTQAKWWGQSMTLWGVLITTASTVVPALGPLVGIDISAEMVREIGSQGLQVAQAVGGLAGTLMTVFGRIRAAAPLRLTWS